jgi:hypothetical protein
VVAVAYIPSSVSFACQSRIVIHHMLTIFSFIPHSQQSCHSLSLSLNI